MQIDFPAYCFLTFIPVFWRGPQQNLGKEGKLKEIPANPGAPSITTHRVGSSSNENPRISSEPGLGTHARGAGCGKLLALQNSQGKMFSLWWGTAFAWVALLQNVPQVTASAWVECLTHANVLFAWTAGVIPFIKTHGIRPCSSRNCHSSSSPTLLICQGSIWGTPLDLLSLLKDLCSAVDLLCLSPPCVAAAHPSLQSPHLLCFMKPAHSLDDL